jgi:hypothetical protein
MCLFFVFQAAEQGNLNELIENLEYKSKDIANNKRY